MMINVVVIAVGKLEKEYWKLAFNEYLKRLQPYIKLTVHHINEVSWEKNYEVNLKLEAKSITEVVKRYPSYQMFLLDINGKLISSEDFAQLLNSNQNFYQGKILFIIGSSNGVSNEFKNNPKIQMLSFGKITLPHQAAQVILMEQLYRACQILNNKSYHK